MPIPDFQSIMLPLLKILADGKVYKYREIFEALVREFQGLPENKIPNKKIEKCFFEKVIIFV